MNAIQFCRASKKSIVSCALCAVVFSAAACFAFQSDSAKLASPPLTKKQPVVDSYHGVKVTDDYRWLENGQSPATKTWVAAQNAYTHAYLEQMPQRAPIVQYLLKTRKQEQARYGLLEYVAGHLFALKFDPEKSAPLLVTFTSPEDKASERVIVDLNSFIPGHIFNVSWYLPSPNGKTVGLALSTGGSGDASLYVFDVATGKRIEASVPRVNFATGGGSMAWKQDGSGFYYAAIRKVTSAPLQIWISISRCIATRWAPNLRRIDMSPAKAFRVLLRRPWSLRRMGAIYSSLLRMGMADSSSISWCRLMDLRRRHRSGFHFRRRYRAGCVWPGQCALLDVAQAE